MHNDQQAKEWAANEFNIPVEDVLWYNSGSCYDRIGVTTKASADKVSQKVNGQTANGGMLDGMPLGGQTHYKVGPNVTTEHYDVTC